MCYLLNENAGNGFNFDLFNGEALRNSAPLFSAEAETYALANCCFFIASFKSKTWACGDDLEQCRMYRQLQTCYVIHSSAREVCQHAG